MIWVLAYLLTGVAVTFLRFVVVAVLASRFHFARARLHEMSSAVFIAATVFWPVDAVITAACFALIAARAIGAWRTVRRLNRASGAQ